MSDCLIKGQTIQLHHKRNHISPGPAAEALKPFPVMIGGEGGGALRMKRAGDKPAPVRFEAIPGEYIRHFDALLDLIRNRHVLRPAVNAL